MLLLLISGDSPDWGKGVSPFSPIEQLIKVVELHFLIPKLPKDQSEGLSKLGPPCG